MRIHDIDTGLPVTFGNGNGVTFGTGGETITASIAAVSALSGIAVNALTTYTSGTVVFSNGNGVTFGTNAQTITASIAAVSAISGIAVNAATTYTSGTVIFSNANNITFGTNGQTITASASYSQSTSPGAIQAGTQTATSGTVIFSNSNGVTFGMAGSATVTASISYAPTLSLWHNIADGAMMQGSTFNTLSIMPLVPGAPFPGLLTANTFMMGINGAGSQSVSSGSFLLSLGIYTLNAGTLSLLNSVATSITYGSVSNNSTAFSGFRWLTIHSSQWSVQPSFSYRDYWLGYIVSSSNATQSINLVGVPYLNAQGRFGTAGVNQAASAGSFGWAPFFGGYTATTSQMPTSINQSDLNAAATSVGNFLPHVVLNNLTASF